MSWKMRHAQTGREKSVRSRGGRFALSLRELAHELNSMLDGSMRCIGLAQSALNEASADPQAVADASRRLAVAHENMQSMAALLEQALKGRSTILESRPLGDEVRRIMESCRAKADQAGVTMTLHLQEAAESIPIGPLGPIVLNGLRNAIESCSESSDVVRQVEVSIGINSRTEIELFITDTGPGAAVTSPECPTTKSNGHGIGLELCKRIAASLGGRAELMNVPFGGGAVLRVVVPLTQMAQK